MSPWLSERLLRTQTDERLVVLARAGHEGAFVAIVERYRRVLADHARRVAPSGQAEDVLQESLVNAWLALQAGAEVRHLRSWLHGILRNAARRFAANSFEGAEPLVHELGARLATGDTFELRMLVRSTLASVARLPERQRIALTETAILGRSRREVALDLGLSEGAVRQLVHRARRQLRAFATAFVPLPLTSWASASVRDPLAEHATRIAGGVASGSLAGAALKVGATVVGVGAIAASVAAPGPPPSIVAREPPVTGSLHRRHHNTRVTPAVQPLRASAPERPSKAPFTAASQPGPTAGGQLDHPNSANYGPRTGGQRGGDGNKTATSPIAGHGNRGESGRRSDRGTGVFRTPVSAGAREPSGVRPTNAVDPQASAADQGGSTGGRRYVGPSAHTASGSARSPRYPTGGGSGSVGGAQGGPSTESAH